MRILFTIIFAICSIKAFPQASTAFYGSTSDGNAHTFVYNYNKDSFITKFTPFTGSDKDGYTKNLEAFAFTSQQINCYGQQIAYTVGASGGVAPYSGVGTFNFTGGTYSITVTDANGFTATTVLTVTQPPELVANISYLPIQCYGQSIPITIGATGGTPGYSGTFIDTVFAYTDTFIVTDSKGCKDTLIHTITQPTLIQPTVTQVDTPTCAGENIQLDVQATGGTLPYNPASIGIKNVNWIGTYTVHVIDANGCSNSTSLFLYQPSILNVNIQSNLPVYAHDSLHLYTSTVADSFIWQSPNSSIISNNSSATLYNISYGTNAGIYTLTLIDSFGCESKDSIAVNILGTYTHAKVFLSGSYVSLAGKMHDSLRKNKYIPLTEPYGTGLGMQTPFIHVNGGGAETLDSLLLNKTGDSAIVDWVFLQLRKADTPSTVIATKSALLLRNGLIVSATDAVSPVYFRETPPGNYVMSIKHRNHLGIQTNSGLLFNDSLNYFDFTNNSITLFTAVAPNNTNAATRTISGVQTLWAGDINKDRKVRYNGLANDRLPILSTTGTTGTVLGYLKNDINLDGKARYNGLANDRLILLQNTGTTNTTNEQSSN